MIVRAFDFNKDYEDVSSWWKQQDWPVLPHSALGNLGFIAEKEDIKVAATWVLITNTSTFLMEWTIGNPNLNFEDRAYGIKLVTEAACECAKNSGANQIITITNSKRFINKLQEYGFSKMDTNMTSLIRRL